LYLVPAGENVFCIIPVIRWVIETNPHLLKNVHEGWFVIKQILLRDLLREHVNDSLGLNRVLKAKAFR
jgi:hypothetical protein